MKEEWKPDALRETAEEIRSAVKPKSITPEMVGGTLLGLIRHDEILAERMDSLNPKAGGHINANALLNTCGAITFVDFTNWLDDNVPNKSDLISYGTVVTYLTEDGWRSKKFVGMDADEDFQYTGAWVVVLTEDELSQSKADRTELSNVLAEPPLGGQELVELPPYRRLFVDLWNKACGAHGRYNAETGFFELNGLTDIAYDEALKIYQRSLPFLRQLVPSLYWACHSLTGIRTLIYVKSTDGSAVRAFSYTDFEVLRIDCQPSDAQYMFWSSRKLRRIDGGISLAGTNRLGHMFEGCAALENVHLLYLRSNLDLADCPRLDLDTFRVLLADPRNGSTPVTVTVHPVVYAKLSDGENTEWHKLLTDAADKNISFVTV